MIRVFRKIVGLFVFAAVFFGGLEVVLRSFPELIPLTLLKRFHKEPRLEIAQRRSLWNEAQMRVLERDDGGPKLTLFKPHSRIWYDFHGEGEKGFTQMDDRGFCNPQRDPYDRERIEVMSIGDSFTWCVVLSPQATWTSQIGEMTGLSVYNLGRGGIGPYDYLQIFKHFGPPKQPEYVIMNFYEGNDLRDSVRYREHIEAAQEGRVLYTDASDRQARELDLDSLLDYSVVRDSYSLNFAAAGADKIYGGLKNAILRASGGDAPEKVNFRYRLHFPTETVEFNVQNADESEVRFARKLKRGEIDFSAFDGALSNFVALGSEHGFVPIVAYSPSAYTTYADFVDFEDPSLTDLLPWFSRSQRRFLQEKAGELGYLFVDLTPALQTTGRELQGDKLLYHPINVHYTVKGNKVVAAALARVISAHREGKTAGAAK